MVVIMKMVNGDTNVVNNLIKIHAVQQLIDLIEYSLLNNPTLPVHKSHTIIIFIIFIKQ